MLLRYVLPQLGFYIFSLFQALNNLDDFLFLTLLFVGFHFKNFFSWCGGSCLLGRSFIYFILRTLEETPRCCFLIFHICLHKMFDLFSVLLLYSIFCLYLESRLRLQLHSFVSFKYIRNLSITFKICRCSNAAYSFLLRWSIQLL